MRCEKLGGMLVSCPGVPGSRFQEEVVRPALIDIEGNDTAKPLDPLSKLLANRDQRSPRSRARVAISDQTAKSHSASHHRQVPVRQYPTSQPKPPKQSARQEKFRERRPCPHDVAVPQDRWPRLEQPRSSLATAAHNRRCALATRSAWRWCRGQRRCVGNECSGCCKCISTSFINKAS